MTIPDHIQKAIQAYYAERATDEQLAALEDWFREDEAHIKVFAEHGLVEWHMLCEHEKQDAAAILATLREAEERAEPDFSLLDTPASFGPTAPQPKTTGSFGELFSLAGYLAAKTLRSKAAAIGSLAAVLVIGLVLYLVFTGEDNTADAPETANNNNQTGDPGRIGPDHTPAPSYIVATLTAERDAVWDRRPGDDLYAGQRFTLNQGFAEITTNHGAVAIIEAPATIELTTNNNAIRLHAGKLVGICETPLSKGFLVRTPHMDITDLGTRFGVDASRPKATTVHVYEGEVEVVLPDAATSPTPQRLVAGQAARASAGESQLASIDLDHSILSRAVGQNTMPKVLAMTGIGLSKGQTDPDWRVVAVDGKPINTGGEMRAHADTTPGGEGDTGPMFLKIDDALLLAYERTGVFTCRSTFEVPSSFDPATHRLVVWVEGDHSVTAVRINGQPIEVPTNVTKLLSLAFDQALTPGPQQIEVDIQEVNSITALRSGLRVKLELQRKPTTTEPDNP